MLRNYEILSNANPYGSDRVGWTNTKHLAQNGIEEEFQRYTHNYPSTRNTANFDLSPIDVPIGYIYMENDRVCDPAAQRPWTSAISQNAGEFTFDELHYWPAGANGEEFMDSLLSLLQNSGESMDEAVCGATFNWD